MPETTQQDRIDRAAAHLRQVITMLRELDENQGEARSNGFRWALNGTRGVASRLRTVCEAEGFDGSSLETMARTDRVQRPGHDPAGPVVLPGVAARIAGPGPDCTCGPDDILHVAGCARGLWLYDVGLASGHESGIPAEHLADGSRHPRRVSGRTTTAARAARSAVPTFDVFETDNGPGGMSWELHRRRTSSTEGSWLASCGSEDEGLRRAYDENGREPCRVAVFTHATWEMRQETDEEGAAYNPDRIVVVPR